MLPTEQQSAEDEDRYHSYTSNTIPWFVHVLWVLFWCFVLYYLTSYLVPVLRTELLSPP